MQSEEAIKQELTSALIRLQESIEFAKMHRLNRGYDLDFERVMSGIAQTEQAKIGLLRWTLEQTIGVGSK